ncbi:hypothetical protein ACLKA6_002198 [Drosophila palustris]
MHETRKRSRLEDFDNDDKISLIQAVKEKRVLWDVEDKKHFDGIVLKEAWKTVAKKLNRNTNECKTAWKSLRDSYRYHCKRVGADGATSEQPKVVWHFAPYLTFLPKLSSTRRTFNSAFEVEDASTQDRTLDPFESTEAYKDDLSFSNLFDIDESQLEAADTKSCKDSTQSNDNPRKLRKLDKSAESQEVIVSKHSECLDPLETSSPPSVRPILRYWESILNKMDPKTAEAAERAATNMLWKYVKAKANDKDDATDEHDATNLDGNEEDIATPSSDWETGNSSPRLRNRSQKKDSNSLMRLQKELLVRKEQRAQESHEQNLSREKAKLDQEVQEGKLRIKIIELEILEKRAKLDMIYNQ